MKSSLRKFSLCLALLAVGGCATMPAGPSVRVLPAPGKSFEEFQVDDAICRQWASQQIGMTPQQTVNQSTASGAAVGTAAGAVIGAVVGSASGHAGSGAAIGAGSGLLLGSSAGANAGQVSGWEAQRRYDIAYEQCMFTKGNQIPGVVYRNNRVQRLPPPPPAGGSSMPPDYVPSYPSPTPQP